MTRLEELRGRIESRDARIGVIGLGYVGLPLALEFVRAGFRVTGIDLNADKVRVLCEGRSYIEDVPAAEVAKAVTSGRFEPTTDSVALSIVDDGRGFDISALAVARGHLGIAGMQERVRARGGRFKIDARPGSGTTVEAAVPVDQQVGR